MNHTQESLGPRLASRGVCLCWATGPGKERAFGTPPKGENGVPEAHLCF